MEVNGDKNHFLMSENKAIANIDNNRIESEDRNELLGWLKLTFERRIKKLYKTASQKINALAQISDYKYRLVIIINTLLCGCSTAKD